MIYFLLAFLALLIAGSLTLVFLIGRVSRRDEVWRSLNLRLMLIRLPKDKRREEVPSEQIKEKISVMENFYTNLLAVHDTWWNTFVYGKPSFAVEISNPNIGEEILFYVAVPRKFARSLEKIIHASFPSADVVFVDDYNIFNPEGASAVSEVTLERNFIFPVKTYRDMAPDPLKTVTNVFSKIEKQGEGASIQIIARPAPVNFKFKIQKFIKRVEEGKDSIRLSPSSSIIKSLKAIQETVSPPSQKALEERKMKRLTPQEEELLKRAEGKSGKNLFEVNVRLVASAATPKRTLEILQDLESAFGQFVDPASNRFKITRAAGKYHKKCIYHYSFRVFNESKKMILSTEELASIIHFPNVPIETPKIGFAKFRESAPPVNLPGSGLALGYNSFRGIDTKINMKRDDRRRHLYAIGQTGTGKSVFLKNLIRQDIENGEGVCFIDPHGDTVEEILGYVPASRAEDVIYFNPADTSRPLALNMLEFDQRYPEQKTMVVNELFGIFQKLYGAIPESMGPIFEQYFRNSTLLVMDDPATGNTLFEIERVMADKKFRDLKLSRAKNVVVKTFWQQIAEKAGGEASLANMVPYITSKFDTFLANEIMRPILVQEKSAFDFRNVMDQRKILLINLSKGRLGELNSYLLGLIMVGKLLIASLSRTDTPEEERPDFYLYLDEFQNVTTPSIATILSEARKYRLNLTISHQYIGQLEDSIKKAVFGNVGSMISFRIGTDDGEFVERQFTPTFSANDLINLDNYNCYVRLLINGLTTDPFSMKTYAPGPYTKDSVERIKELSRMKYGRPKEEIEMEILEKHS